MCDFLKLAKRSFFPFADVSELMLVTEPLRDDIAEMFSADWVGVEDDEVCFNCVICGFEEKILDEISSLNKFSNR